MPDTTSDAPTQALVLQLQGFVLLLQLLKINFETLHTFPDLGQTFR
jgi:hypothetical protein